MKEDDGGNGSMRREEPCESEIVAEIERMATRLEVNVHKYPKRGKGFFNSAQERYVAALPRPEGSCNTCDGKLSPEIQRWKYGDLAYWENANAFRRKEPPKGHLALLRIAKVHCTKDDKTGRGVIVKHKQGSEMCELALLFPTKRDAEEWSYAMWDFLTRLRDVCVERQVSS